MGERERRRVDGHAVRVAVTRFVLVTVVVGVVGLWFRYLFNHIVSTLVRGVSVPVWAVLLAATVVGGIAGRIGLRGAGRYVAPGGDVEPVHGSRALGIVLANRRAERERPVAAASGVVRVWSADLLLSGDRDDDTPGEVT